MDIVQDLQRQGWYLSENGIKECKKTDSATVDDVTREALNMDLKQIGEKHLPESLGKSKTEFVDGPFILQIQKVLNVSVPKDSEQSSSDGSQKLYRLTLTDGPGTCTAVDMNGISGLSRNTPPGSKIKLLGRVPVNQGFLLLNNSNCKLIGGRVEKLVESWELKRALTMQSRASVTTEGGPPPFIPFGQRRKDAGPVSNKRDNFRSLDSVAKKKETDCDFEQQRKANIEAALLEGKTKSFGSASVKQTQDQNIASIVDMGFSVEQASAALKKSCGNLEGAVSTLLGDGDSAASNVSAQHSSYPRHSNSQQTNRVQPLLNNDRSERTGGGRRRAGRSEDVEDFADQHTKPSAPATLFDFVTNIIPKKTEKTAPKCQLISSEEGSVAPDGDGDRVEEQVQQPQPEADNQASEKQQHRSSETTTPGRQSPEDRHQNSTSSASQGNSSSHSYQHPVQNLPPRLQKKQQREEEEKLYKFTSKDAAFSDWTRDRLSNKVYDVNSRGPVSHKNLWTDDKDDRNKEKNYDQREKQLNQKSKSAERKTGDEKSGEAGDKNYHRNVNNGVAYQRQYMDSNQAQQTMHVQEVTSRMKCTPVSVQPLMQCATDGVQLMQSMSALHLYPAAPVQVATTPFVPGHTAVPSSAVCDSSTVNMPKENLRWKAGDVCMAKWQDKEFYRAKIVQAEPSFALVNFVDYGNMSSVPYSDLMPMRSAEPGGVLYHHPTIQSNSRIMYTASGAQHGTGFVYPSQNGHFTAAPVANTAGSAAGMIVQGPGTFSSYPMDHSYRIVTNSGRSNMSKSKKSNEKQLYIPPAGRK